MNRSGELGVIFAVFRLTSEKPVVRTHLCPPGRTPDFITARLTAGRACPSYDSAIPNTKAARDITEAVVLAEFLRAGFPVCVPFGDNRRYDLVVEAAGRFLRVQCKTASLTSDRCGGKGCIRFKARSGVHESRPHRGQGDLFAASSPSGRLVCASARCR
jgi:PD-(D/E)XK endonuclease